MLLEKLKLKNFKRFKDLNLEFKSGINIVKGPNERGKSTLVDAITTVLFEDPKSSAKKLLENKSWATPKKMYEISVEFKDAEDVSYLLHKDFEKKETIFKNLKTNEEIGTHEEALSFIQKNLGIGNPVIFENTVCIKQDMLSILSRGKVELKEALEALVTSGRGVVSTKEVQRKLDKEISELSRGLGSALAKNPGKVKLLQDELVRREEELREGAAELRAKDELTKSLSAGRKKSKEFSIILKEKLNLFERNKEYFETTLKIQEIERRLKPLISNLEGATVLKKRILELGDELKKFGNVPKKDLKKLERELTRLSEKIDLRKKNVKELEKILKKTKQRKVIPSRLTAKENFYLIAAIFFVIGFLGLFISPLFFVFWAVAIIVFLTPFLLHLKTIPITTEEKDVFSDSYRRLQSELRELVMRRETILKELGIKDEKDFEKLKDQVEDLFKEKEKKEEKLKGVLGEMSLTDLENEKLELIKSFGVLESRITSEQKKEPPKRENQEKLELEIKNLSIEVESLKKEIVKNEGRLENIKINQEVLIKKDEEIDILKKELGNATLRLKVFYVVKEVLALSSSATIEKSREAVMSYVNSCLGRITENRYQRVHLDEDLNIFVYSNEKHNWVRPEEELSRGTIDQIYLTVRFAFVDFLAAKKNPFLILDDPLVTFDWNRQLESLKVLEELSSKFQIIFLTHSNRYDKWGSNVIALK